MAALKKADRQARRAAEVSANPFARRTGLWIGVLENRHIHDLNDFGSNERRTAMYDLMKRLFADEEGQGLTEYALIIAFVAVVIIAVLIAFRGQIEGVFTSAGTELSNPH